MQQNGFLIHLAFDGYTIWVTHNGAGGGLTRLLAYNGNIPGQVYATGHWPQGLVFDGASIWVANGDDNTLTKH